MTTDDDTLRRVARSTYASMADRRCSCERLRAVDELAQLVGAWRSAPCLNDTIEDLRKHPCDGENHVQGCPTAAALDDVIAAHDKLGAPGMT